MRSLTLKNPNYYHLQVGFEEWLIALGYSKSVITYLPSYLQEFLCYLEHNEFNGCWTETPVKSYLEYLKIRKNKRREGGLSNHSINNHIYTLSKFSEYLFKVHQQTLPVKASPLETPVKKEAILTPAQIRDLYAATAEDALGSRDRAMLSIFYGCGLRRSEGERLNVEDIMLNRNAVLVRESKNGKSRLVPMSEGVKHHLQDYLAHGRPMFVTDPLEQAFFVNRRGYRISGGNLYVRLKKLLAASGLDQYCPEAGLHTLRHSIATHLMESGMKIEDVSRFLGHRSLESTQTYTHLKNERYAAA